MAGARMARNEGGQRARRSLTSTLPADFAPASQAWLSDRPSWCVDMGSTLLAMTTCDLWLSLARNDVTPRTKVWREGMPYWEALEKVPEFALALPDASVWGAQGTVKPMARAAVEEMSTSPSGGDGGKAAGWLGAAREPSAAEVITMAPPGDLLTPAPVVVEHRSHAEPAPAGKRRVFPRLDRRGAASVAFGAAVAIGALTLATTGPVSPRTAGDEGSASHAHAAIRYQGPSEDLAAIVRASSIGPEKAAVVDQDSAEFAGDLRAAPAATSVEETRPAPTVARSVHTPRGPRATDRGQHRAR